MGATVTTGWHPDPFGVHEARYFSADGQPTKLVRDRGAESFDEPPSGPDEVAAAMARMAAVPEPPSASAYRDAYPYDSAPERDPWRPSLARLAVTLIIAAAVAVVVVLLLEPMLRAPKPASTQGGATDIAFVTQAATRTLQQRTASLVLSGSTTGANPTAALASLASQGITVRALGTKDIGGVSCTGYAVTPPGEQGTTTVWINPQHLVREISLDTPLNISADASAGGASPRASPVGTAVTKSIDLTMDFTYSAAPLHVTAPPAATTLSYDAYLKQLGQHPALNQLEPSGAT